MKSSILVIFTIVHFNLWGQYFSDEVSWTKIDEGLFYTEYSPPNDSVSGVISILKIDPKFYEFNLFSAKEPGEKSRTVQEWAEEKNQIAVINAGMYQGDNRTNVGYMKDYSFINNGHINKNNAILAFNRKINDVPPVQIIDLQCQDWETLKNKYNSFTQSIRMVDCHQKNCWAKKDEKWSMVAIGMDKKGNAMFLFSRYAYTVHDFIDILLEAPIDVYNALYLEGGPPASFFLNYNKVVEEKVGSYESRYFENDDNARFWPLPNVIGISKKHQ
jgi:uncharacterized protein YigE (DUF2233 family)